MAFQSMPARVAGHPNPGQFKSMPAIRQCPQFYTEGVSRVPGNWRTRAGDRWPPGLAHGGFERLVSGQKPGGADIRVRS